MIKPLYIIMGGVALLLFTGIGTGSVVSRAVDFIAKQEGFRASPYWDYKQWSIGYGTRIGTDPNTKPAVTWTPQQGRDALTEIVSSDYERIRAMLQVPLNSNQLVALLSFAYNAGVGSAQKIIERINDGLSLQAVTDAMKLYKYAGGVVSANLVARRQLETDLYVS